MLLNIIEYNLSVIYNFKIKDFYIVHFDEIFQASNLAVSATQKTKELGLKVNEKVGMLLHANVLVCVFRGSRSIFVFLGIYHLSIL